MSVAYVLCHETPEAITVILGNSWYIVENEHSVRGDSSLKVPAGLQENTIYVLPVTTVLRIVIDIVTYICLKLLTLTEHYRRPTISTAGTLCRFFLN